MKIIYFLSNNLLSEANFVYDLNDNFERVEKERPLSIEGEEKNLKLSKENILEDIEVIYSSTYFSAIDTSKYFKSDIKIYLDKALDERQIGDLGDNEYRYLKGMQEHDFTYKLPGGESIEEVKLRITKKIKEILNKDEDNILVVSHHIALMSLFLNWCNKSHNLNDDLILEYKENPLFDGTTKDIDLIKVVFDDMRIVDIERIK